MRTITTLRSGRMMPLRFDKVIVWNEIQARELVKYHGYAHADVFVAGIPQFDFYLRHQYRPRPEVIRGLGGDPSKRLITFAAGNSNAVVEQIDILSLLVNAIREQQFIMPAQLLVRGHPGCDISSWQRKFGEIPGVLFQTPTIAHAAVSCARGWHVGDEDQSQLADVLHHSDVVVNIASTIAVDAAALDRPIVGVGFDGCEERPYYQSIAKYYDLTHQRPVVESGGLRIARSPADLIQFINRYLEHPELDRQGRQRLVEQLCPRLDGRAGERIGNFLVGLLPRTEQNPQREEAHHEALVAAMD